MKVVPPDISDELVDVNDLPGLLRKDETLSGLSIHDASAAGLRLKSAVINDAKLVKCDLSQATIEKLQLQDCIIDNCDLTASVLADSSWHAVEVIKARCSGIQLHTSLLKNVLFRDCKLDMANLRFAQLENVVFENCIITELDLYTSKLKNVSFIGCDIEDVEFSDAQLHHVDLSRSTIVSVKGIRGLKGAHISPEQLIQLAPYLAQEIGLIVTD